MRWELKHRSELKYAIGLVNLHARKDEHIQQEIYAALIMYNSVRESLGQLLSSKKPQTI